MVYGGDVVSGAKSAYVSMTALATRNDGVVYNRLWIIFVWYGSYLYIQVWIIFVWMFERELA